MLREVGLRRGLHAVGVVAVEDGVEVGRQDLGLRPAVLELQREPGLVDLALRGALERRFGQVQVAHHLLRDGGGALADLTARDVAPGGARDALVVERAVVPEAPILDRDRRRPDAGRDSCATAGAGGCVRRRRWRASARGHRADWRRRSSSGRSRRGSARRCPEACRRTPPHPAAPRRRASRRLRTRLRAQPRRRPCGRLCGGARMCASGGRLPAASSRRAGPGRGGREKAAVSWWETRRSAPTKGLRARGADPCRAAPGQSRGCQRSRVDVRGGWSEQGRWPRRRSGWRPDQDAGSVPAKPRRAAPADRRVAAALAADRPAQPPIGGQREGRSNRLGRRVGFFHRLLEAACGRPTLGA